MLSLKTLIERNSRDDKRFQVAFECYLGVLKDIQENAVEIDPLLTADYRNTLQALHRDLSSASSPESLEGNRSRLKDELQGYRAKAAACLSQKDEDLRAVLCTVGHAAEMLSEQNNNRSERLKEFTQQLQTIARGTELARMRRDLSEQVTKLKVAGESMWKESHGSVAQMQSKLVEFQERLEHAERRASTDALTGLLNRGEGEARLTAQLERGGPVSVVLIDLNGFKQINDRWGHSCGDQILKGFSHNLSRAVRPSDIVCRWGGDEFLVILPGDETLARQTAGHLRERFRVRHKVAVLGRVIEVEVSACLGVAQARIGETAGDVVANADNDMYRHKTSKREAAKLVAG